MTQNNVYAMPERHLCMYTYELNKYSVIHILREIKCEHMSVHIPEAFF